MKILNKVREDISNKENLDVYLTLFLAFVIAILNVFQVKVGQDVLFSAILTTLGLISFSLLVNRKNDDELVKKINDIEELVILSETGLKTGFDQAKLKTLIRDNARTLLFWAGNATSTLPLISDDIEVQLKKGLQAKFIFIEPESDAAKMHAFRNRYQKIDAVNTVLGERFTRLAAIAKNNPNGTIHVKTVNYLPPFSIISINHESEDGIMFVRLFTFRIPNSERPYLELNRKQHSEWFEFFLKQFEKIWEVSNELDLMKYRSN